MRSNLETLCRNFIIVWVDSSHSHLHTHSNSTVLCPYCTCLFLVSVVHPPQLLHLRSLLRRKQRNRLKTNIETITRQSNKSLAIRIKRRHFTALLFYTTKRFMKGLQCTIFEQSSLRNSSFTVLNTSLSTRSSTHQLQPINTSTL